MNKMIKEEMFVFAESDNDSSTGMNVFLVPKRWEYYPGDSSIKLGMVEVSYESFNQLTEDQLRLLAIKTLQDKQQRVVAEAQAEKQRLQGKIDDLQLLTHQTGKDEVIVAEFAKKTEVSDGDDIPF